MSSITRFPLPNGLRVIHAYTPAARMAVVNTLYDVGSRDEAPDHTGMAHLFEHLMFGGSVNIPDFDAPLQKAGGNSNAWTSADFTCFHNILPAHNIDTALWLESDRMLSLSFSDKALEVQRSVVIEEFKQVCLNRPYGDMSHLLHKMSFSGTPYETPVIGRDFHDIEKTTQQDVRSWFFSHYGPDSAILSIVSCTPPDQLRRKIEHWYGDIPRRNISPRSMAPFRHPAPSVVEASGKVPNTVITLAYPMGAYKSADYIPADLITDILANGQSSRFYRRLLTPGKHFAGIDASILGSELPGILMVNATLLHTGAQAEKEAVDAIDREIRRLREEPVEQAELDRCINRIESDHLFAMINPLEKAQAMAKEEYHGETYEEISSRYHAVTPAIIRDTAASVLAPEHRSMLVYRPQ